ncbi:nitroreductase [Nocardioides sambongensis]|uniref:nitroreductase n=1 Tax=Nocardioides sambongensis TaxID=2589074 RepID=UPI001E3D7193|nr:nitroreductase [Nocardioides sambongensis]
MDFGTLMEQRWSCRAFRPEPLEDELVTEILTVAQRTPSWCNTQPWQVHLLGGDALEWFRKELRARVEAEPFGVSSDVPLPGGYLGVYDDRRRAAGYALYESLGIERGDKAARAEQMLRNYDFFDAPHAVIVTSDRIQGTYGALDCGAYVTNLMNAALDRGVGTIAQGAIGIHSGAVRRLLGLPEDRIVLCAVAFGRPAEDHPVNTFRTDRAALDDVVHVVERP